MFVVQLLTMSVLIQSNSAKQVLLTILIHQVTGTVHASQGGLLQATIFSNLLFLSWAECHNHGVPSKLHDITIIQQNQINDLKYRQGCLF